MTLIFNWFRAVVKTHVRTKIHQAMYSGSWVIVVTERKNFARVLKTVLSSLRRTVIILRVRHSRHKTACRNNVRRGWNVCHW